MLVGNEFQSLGRAIVKEDEYEEVRWDSIVSIVSWRERVFRLWWEERCVVLPQDGLKSRWLDFRHNTHWLVLFVLLCLQQVKRVPYSLRGGNYFVFLRDVLPELLENIPLNIRERIWFQHDGAPPHFDRRVRNHLNATFPDRGEGRGPRSAFVTTSHRDMDTRSHLEDL
ncbi:hypothetical protein ANN_25714 [Periplaneta americana]|uniref:Transposable element Tc3 transposase n=1 Tax=Periplaneta americana TaxID=6978 RepID=A0ABQ8S4B9_PERAM|nr:hypothetical protein ANN_25714 [Periplaneta americana]